MHAGLPHTEQMGSPSIADDHGSDRAVAANHATAKRCGGLVEAGGELATTGRVAEAPERTARALTPPAEERAAALSGCPRVSFVNQWFIRAVLAAGLPVWVASCTSAPWDPGATLAQYGIVGAFSDDCSKPLAAGGVRAIL